MLQLGAFLNIYSKYGNLQLVHVFFTCFCDIFMMSKREHFINLDIC